MLTCSNVYPLAAGQHFKSRAPPGLQQRSMPGPSGPSAPASRPTDIGPQSAAADSAAHAPSPPSEQGAIPGRLSELAGRVCSGVSARLKDSVRGNAGSAAPSDSAKDGAQNSAAQHAPSAASMAAADRGAGEPSRLAAPSWQQYIDDVDELGCDMTPEKLQQECHSARQLPPVGTVTCYSFATQYD